jgi:hypothetical protein
MDQIPEIKPVGDRPVAVLGHKSDGDRRVTLLKAAS